MFVQIQNIGNDRHEFDRKVKIYANLSLVENSVIERDNLRFRVMYTVNMKLHMPFVNRSRIFICCMSKKS